jgi:signal transduction histidine kinase
MIAFALGALALSAFFAAVTYQLARSYLLRQRETSVMLQTYANARLARSALETRNAEIPRLLASLETPAGASPLLYHEGRWFSASLAVGSGDLPAGLKDVVLSGSPARQRFRLEDEPRLAVGVPLRGTDDAYFEVFPLRELTRTLQVLRNTLAGAAVLTALGGAGMGLLVARRVLAPLRAVGQAASSVAAGKRGVHLDVGPDPELASLAISFNHMTDALQERIHRETRFASTVSHELRSPLTTLAASLEVLQARRHELPERARAALDLLASEVDRFQSLVQDLLEMSRLDAGVADPALEEVRLGEFVLHALARFGETQVDLDQDASEMVVCVDKRRLERVVANLVENAESHGGGVVRVTVEPGASGVRLAVEDSGPGVPAEERQRIFERFSRGRAASRRDAAAGTGLGLSLVSEHVRLHGGRVWVEDRPGGGARFVVELPVAEP